MVKCCLLFFTFNSRNKIYKAWKNLFVLILFFTDILLVTLSHVLFMKIAGINEQFYVNHKWKTSLHRVKHNFSTWFPG